MSDIRFTPHCDAAAHHLFTCKECLECPYSGDCWDAENWKKLLAEFPEHEEEEEDQEGPW